MSYQSPGFPPVPPVLVPTYAYAGWWQRVGAYVIDQLVALLAGIPVLIGIVLLIAGSDATTHTDLDGTTVIDDASLNGLGVVGIIVIVLGVIFMIAFTIWNIVFRQGSSGASLGKSALGLLLVKEETGKPVGAGMSFLRQLCHILDSFCYIGYLWPIWDDKKQTFADKCVSSVVIQQRS
ncbi:RDD family protein [Nocardioides sp. Kera G14]|uniref:RDD family protein n=1 Tax=Nocardioides sp. Kera G14 TaxID=2884264 RepID=UPI001D11EA9F|nr:RDD family protein [Nocardioides sp. Kera G14]UDY23488.1 RDD family protein [Nocardioides sp. Kera G14]